MSKMKLMGIDLDEWENKTIHKSFSLHEKVYCRYSTSTHRRLSEFVFNEGYDHIVLSYERYLLREGWEIWFYKSFASLRDLRDHYSFFDFQQFSKSCQEEELLDYVDQVLIKAEKLLVFL